MLNNTILDNKELYSFSIVGSFFALWLSAQISPSIESNIAYIMILTVGILHGSNDIMLVNHTLRSNLNISLSIFVIFSSYHFGEQHFISKSKVNNYLLYLYYASYGMLIFSMIFFSNPDDVIIIVNEITNVSISIDFIQYLFYSSLGFTILLSYIIHSKSLITFKIFEELILLVLLYVIFNIASLIAGFAIYFIIWHSIPSLKDQIIELHNEFNKENLLMYLKNSALYWLISMISLFLLYFLISDDKLFISLFFSFLAAITFPHVIVMFNLFRKKL